MGLPSSSHSEWRCRLSMGCCVLFFLLPLDRLCRIALVAMAIVLSGTPLAAVEPKLFLKLSRLSQAPEAAKGLCAKYAWACTSKEISVATPAIGISRVFEINARINSKVRILNDQLQYGKQDHWTLPSARGGDCEDIALLKKKKLIEMGLPPRSLLLATVLDHNREGHAVLVLRTRSGDFVLDNLRNRILPWHETGYLFLRMQHPRHPNRWGLVASEG